MLGVYHVDTHGMSGHKAIEDEEQVNLEIN
jgi:hypothetical protein